MKNFKNLEWVQNAHSFIKKKNFFQFTVKRLLTNIVEEVDNVKGLKKNY
jgi:hypothetical protein